MVEVYGRPLRERFIASRCSIAYLFRCCWWVALTVTPIYIAYSTGDFWRKQNTYLEQPIVFFTKQLIISGVSATGAPVIQYSTLERFNYLIGYENVKQPAIRSWYTDSNLDTKPDVWDINLVFPLEATDPAIVSVTALLNFHVNYQEQVNVDMDAQVQLTSPGGVAGNKWTAAGDLTLFQRNPFPRTAGTGVRNVYQYPIVNDSTIKVLDDVQLDKLMLANQARNDTLLVDAQHIWQTTAGSQFNISFHFTVPTTTVAYTPSPGETIKFAFIQWLAMFWILYFGLTFIRDFVYGQNIVETMRIRDGTPVAKVHQF